MLYRAEALRQDDALAAMASESAALIDHELITLVYRKKDQLLDGGPAAPLHLTDIVSTIQAAEIKAINHVSVPSGIVSTHAVAAVSMTPAPHTPIPPSIQCNPFA